MMRSIQFNGTSITAYYSLDAYRPPRSPVIVASGMSLALGRGQRVAGFSVSDQPEGMVELLVPFFGRHSFTQVTDIYVHDEIFADSDIELVLALPEVRAIVSYTSITDIGLVKLAAIAELVLLDVSGTSTTGKALRQFAKCRKLQELCILHTDVDQEAVDYL